MAFAPFDDPQIAVAVVLEHGVRGANAGQVAKDVFDQYFFGSNQQGTDTSAEQATPTADTSGQTEAGSSGTGLLR